MIVATVRALKMHGGVAKADLKQARTSPPSPSGCENLTRHIENVGKFGVPAVVAINRFITDTDAEVAVVMEVAAACRHATPFICTHWADGLGKGTEALAHQALSSWPRPASATFAPLYPDRHEPARARSRPSPRDLPRRRHRAAMPRSVSKLQGLGGAWASAICRSAWPRRSTRFSTDPAKRGAPT